LLGVRKRRKNSTVFLSHPIYHINHLNDTEEKFIIYNAPMFQGGLDKGNRM